ncbi:MAG TPA: hypothetical protein PKB10_07330 [Tepidisphaeraceae bacterium]|nr:hypothetical protein [Tepidisphaeraceae bacterium]
MSFGFAQSLWLLAVVPVAGLGIWLLVGRPARTTVPFLMLWPRRRVGPASRARRRLPPLAVISIWIALLLSALGLAGPTWRTATPVLPLTIVIDTGSGVSAARLAKNIASLRELLRAARPGEEARVTLVGADGQADKVPIARLSAEAGEWRAAEAMAELLEARLRTSDDLIISVSDRPAAAPGERVRRIASLEPLRNNAIESLAIAHGQLMIIARTTQTDAASLEATISSDPERAIDVSLQDGRGMAFVDLPGDPQEVAVQLAGSDDVPADDAMTLRRVAGRPAVGQVGALPASVVRLIEAYRDARPPTGGVDAIAVTMSDPGTRAGVWIVPGLSGGAVGLQDHPITRGLSESALPLGALMEDAAGWRVIATVNDRAAMTVRTSPARQVRLGRDIEQAAVSAEAIALLTRCIDWVADTETPAYLPADRPVSTFAPPPADERERLHRRIAEMTPRTQATSLVPFVSILAAGLIVAALLLARR